MFDEATLSELNPEPVTIAVVGTVNVGKSSTLKTLVRDRDAEFPIDNRVGTTIDVNPWKAKFCSTTYMRFLDTPGLQHATEALESVKFGLHFSVEEIQQFFWDHGHLEDHEALRGAVDSDYLLYVVDVTKKPGRARINEFAILQKIKPMITLFNFVGNEDVPNEKEAWEEKLRNYGMNMLCEYDAHRFDVRHEEQLFKKLLASTEEGSVHFRAIDGHREIMAAHRSKQTGRAVDTIVDLLVECAIPEKEEHVERDVWKNRAEELQEELSDKVAEVESECLKSLLDIHELPTQLLERKAGGQGSSVEEGDEFFSENWKQWIGTGVASGAVSGAITGATIDAFTGGTSMMMGTLIGTGIGAALGIWGGNAFKTRFDTHDKRLTVAITDDGLKKLLAHSLQLLFDVQRRGMADDVSEFRIGSDAAMIKRFERGKCREHVAALLECVAPDQLNGVTQDSFDKGRLKRELQKVMKDVEIWGVNEVG